MANFYKIKQCKKKRITKFTKGNETVCVSKIFSTFWGLSQRDFNFVHLLKTAWSQTWHRKHNKKLVRYFKTIISTIRKLKKKTLVERFVVEIEGKKNGEKSNSKICKNVNILVQTIWLYTMLSYMYRGTR